MGVGSLFSSLKNLASRALSSVKRALGIKSPSAINIPEGVLRVESLEGITERY